MMQNGLFQVFDSNKNKFLISKLQITLYHPRLWDYISCMRLPSRGKNQWYHSVEGVDVEHYV